MTMSRFRGLKHLICAATLTAMSAPLATAEGPWPILGGLAGDDPGPFALTLSDQPRSWNDRTDAWRFRLSPILWTSGIDGTVGGERATSDVDQSFTDLLENLDFGLAFDFEVGKGPWSVLFFGAYYEFEVDGETPRGRDVDVSSDFAIADVAIAYKVFDTPVGDDGRLALEPLAGVRWTYVSLDLDITGPRREFKASRDRDWFDPYVGARIRWDFDERWNWSTTGTVGGFGVGSDTAWSIHSFVEYRFTPRWSAIIGYRLIDYDYDDNGFVWDVAMHGPVIGVSVRW